MRYFIVYTLAGATCMVSAISSVDLPDRTPGRFMVLFVEIRIQVNVEEAAGGGALAA